MSVYRLFQFDINSHFIWMLFDLHYDFLKCLCNVFETGKRAHVHIVPVLPMPINALFLYSCGIGQI